MTLPSRPILIALFSIAAAGLSAQSETPVQPSAPAAIDPELAQEIREKQQELQEIGQKFSVLEQQVRSKEPVQERLEDLRETTLAEMIRNAPDQKTEVERQAHLLEKLTSAEADPAKQEARMNEYGQLRERLIAVEQKAQQSPAVLEAQDKFVETMIEEMNKIDPEAEKLYERMVSLSREVQELQMRAARS